MNPSRETWIVLGLLVAAVVACAAIEPAPELERRRKNPSRPRRRRRRSSREVEVERCERSAAREARPSTFRRKAEGVRALLDANPDLNELLESECADDCSSFKGWQKGGRRGPKPPGRKDGRFDAFNERYELRGKKKVGSWLEGVYKSVPASRRWEDFDGRLGALEEASGLRVNAPERTDRVRLARQSSKRCKEAPELEEAPF